MGTHGMGPSGRTVEADPNGLDPSAPGAKLDVGKIRLYRSIQEFSRAQHEVGRVGDYGAKKYSEGGWRHVPDGFERYTQAMLRHVVHGADMDPETGLLHAGQAAWNALARLEISIADEWRRG